MSDRGYGSTSSSSSSDTDNRDGDNTDDGLRSGTETDGEGGAALRRPASSSGSESDGDDRPIKRPRDDDVNSAHSDEEEEDDDVDRVPDSEKYLFDVKRRSDAKGNIANGHIVRQQGVDAGPYAAVSAVTVLTWLKDMLDTDDETVQDAIRRHASAAARCTLKEKMAAQLLARKQKQQQQQVSSPPPSSTNPPSTTPTVDPSKDLHGIASYVISALGWLEVNDATKAQISEKIAKLAQQN
eukprot:PhM_4_TR13099/c0_g1_i1/m.5729